MSRSDFAKAPSAEVMLRKAFTPEVEHLPETRSIRFTISTDGVDRDNDIITASGWDIGNYVKSPVVLWAHQYDQLPVGKASNIKVSGNKLSADAEFVDKETYPFADTVYRMLKGGFLGGTSVGFRPKTFQFNEKRQGFDFAEQELLEFSVVPIPANPDALMEARAAGVLDEGDVEVYTKWAEDALIATKGAGRWARKIFPVRAALDKAAATEAWVLAPDLSVFTTETWSDLSEEQRKDVGSHFAFTASAFPPKEFSDLRLAHHDPKTGKVSWAGVVAAFGELLREGSDIPEGARKSVHAHLAQHCKDLGKPTPDCKVYPEAGDVWAAMLSAETIKVLPTPNEGEAQDDFVGRCMGNETMRSEYDTQDQRLGVCYSQYRQHHKAAVAKAYPGCPDKAGCPRKPGMDDCPRGAQCPMADKPVDEKTVTKVGRVLASRNENRLRQAASMIADVLRELDALPSVDPVDAPDAKHQKPAEPAPKDVTPDPKTTDEVLFELEDEPVTKSHAPSGDDTVQLEDLSADAVVEMIRRGIDKAMDEHRRSITGELD